MPSDAGWRGLDSEQVAGIAVLGGIGFTVSLFVTNLAFRTTPALVSDAKLGVLSASLIAALLGSCVLLLATRNRARQSGPGT